MIELILTLAWVGALLWWDALGPFVLFALVMCAVPVGMITFAALVLGATVRS